MTAYSLPSLRGILCIVIVGLLAPWAGAIPLDFSSSGVGYYSPGSAYNNDAEVTIAANKLVDWYNGGTSPNPDPNASFFLGIGSGLPAVLPAGLIFGYKDEEPPYDGFDDVNPAYHSYVLGKYGQGAYLFYVGGLGTGSYSLPTTMAAGGLSHAVYFTVPSQTIAVPDGGATIALLGMSLLILEVLRRRFKGGVRRSG